MTAFYDNPKSKWYIPQKEDKGLIKRMRKFAKKHRLAIYKWNFERKIDWMVEHGGRCFCACWDRLKCPCKECLKEVKEEGSCLCSIFVTREWLRRHSIKKAHRDKFDEYVKWNDEELKKLEEEDVRK